MKHFSRVGMSIKLSLLVYCLTLPLLAVASDWIYISKRGDTLWNLCLEYTSKRGCWMELGDYNNIKDDRAISPGSEIRIPATWLKVLPEVAVVKSAAPTATYKSIYDNEFASVEVNQPLRLGSTVKSGAGPLMLVFHERHRVLMRPNSQLEIDSYAADKALDVVELELLEGEVEADVENGNKAVSINTRAGPKAGVGTNKAKRALSD